MYGRRGALVISAVMALALSSCGSGDSAKAGRRATAKPGDRCPLLDEVLCRDATSAIVCVGGTYEATPCRQGCSTMNDSDACTNAERNAGEYCFLPVGHEHDRFFRYRCSADGKSLLECRDNHWAVDKACPGRRGCWWVNLGRGRRQDEYAACDEALIAAGASCAREGQHECTSVGHDLMRCQDGRWTAEQRCRGPAGCSSAKGTVKCDDTRTEVGDTCTAPGSESCSVDGQALLTCKSGKMARARPCKTGCRVTADVVRATTPGARVVCN
jgi:hypothetical protein